MKQKGRCMMYIRVPFDGWQILYFIGVGDMKTESDHKHFADKFTRQRCVQHIYTLNGR